MNVLYLKYATEVAKTGSIGTAAENLFVAQPALSQAIKELENSLGIAIFTRTAKGMMLTPDGQKLMQYAKSALNQLDQIEKMFKGGQPHKQVFSISVPRASYISYAFSHFTKHIDSSVPAEIFYNETDPQNVIGNILNNDYRLGIVRSAGEYVRYFMDLFETKGFSYELITRFSFGLIMREDCPLAKLDEVYLKDLNDYIEIAHADPYVPSIPVPNVLKTELPDTIDKRIFVFERGSQFDILSDNPKTFMWVSKIPQELLDKHRLVQRKCKDNTRVYHDMLIYKREYQLTELDKSFISELFEAKTKYFVG